MDISRVRYNLGKSVRLTLDRHYVNAIFILTGCMFRKNSNGTFYYQAELQDINTKSVIMARLDDIEEMKGLEK